MATTLPETATPCCDPCEEPVSVAVPGAAGAAGSNGTNGDDGVNAFTTTTAQFAMPAEGADVTVSVADSTWMTPTQIVYVQNAGWMEVRSKPDGTSVVLRNIENTGNLEYTDNVAPTTAVATSSQISPGGLQGPAGADGVSGAPTSASYWTRAAEAALSGESNLDALAAGSVVKTNTGGSGAPATADLCTAIEALAANGFIARTSASTSVARTLQGTANEILVSNGNGSGGDPVFSLHADVYRVGGADVAIADGGTGASTAAGARSNLGLDTDIVSDAYYEEQQADGVDAGGFTSGAWQTRLLNTEVHDAGNIGTIASNQITLGAGTYRFEGWAVAFNVDEHQTRLYDITNATTLKAGSVAVAAATDGNQNTSFVRGRFTVGALTVIQLQHRCTSTKATDGFGKAGSFGVGEVYSGLWIGKESA